MKEDILLPLKSRGSSWREKYKLQNKLNSINKEDEGQIFKSVVWVVECVTK